MYYKLSKFTKKWVRRSNGECIKKTENQDSISFFVLHIELFHHVVIVAALDLNH